MTTDEDTIRELAARKGRDTLSGVDKGKAKAIARRRPDLRGAVAELLDASANTLPSSDGVAIEGGAIDNITIGEGIR